MLFRSRPLHSNTSHLDQLYLFIYLFILFPKASISQGLIYTTPLKKISTPSQPFTSTYFFFFRLLNLCFFRHSNFPVHTFSFFLPFFSFLKPVYATSRLSRGTKTRQGEKEKKSLHLFFFWNFGRLGRYKLIRPESARISPIQRTLACVSASQPAS